MGAHASRRIVLSLLAVAALAAPAFVVLSPATVAGPQIDSGTCCSSPTVSSGTAMQDTASAASTDTNAPPTDPPGTIEGAKNPELIPDEVAYKMLFISLVEPEYPTAEQEARQQANFGMINLSADDTAVLLEVLGDFRNQMSGLDAQVGEILKVTPVPAPGSADWLNISDVEQQKDRLVTDTVETLGARLSPDGVAKLRVHLLDFKRGVKAIPMPGIASYQ
jgi:hypothetical protein